ncbi:MULTISPECIES: ATP-binding protein [Flavobacterium]|uniref:histidine kinase n=1 Tax=Flavobacterium endoglycinae TaxID=2816357 RepID=A0ABX7QB20_9FLAO|nr:ATP-binding protein [Flavobacterium endoglycinae]QSW88147.1 histidine kinase [Flavobacterium endoglycinae]
MFIRIFILFLFFTFNGTKAAQLSSADPNYVAQQNVEKTTVSKNQKLEQLRNKKVVSLSIILIILLFFLFYYVYQNNKLKQKIKRKDTKQKILLNVIDAGIDSQETEQKKIASFLHDNVNSLLSSAGLHLNVFTAKNNIQSEEIQKAKAILQEAHDLLRDISHDLIPTLLVRFGLIYALEDLCEKNSNSDIQFRFSSSLSTETRYSEKFEMKLYFIISELCSNIIRHSGAQKAQISLHEHHNKLIIIIHDNGKGFNAEKIDEIEGFGLNRIRVRIKKLKGTFSIISRPDENSGTSIKIKVPIS